MSKLKDLQNRVKNGEKNISTREFETVKPIKKDIITPKSEINLEPIINTKGLNVKRNKTPGEILQPSENEKIIFPTEKHDEAYWEKRYNEEFERLKKEHANDISFPVGAQADLIIQEEREREEYLLKHQDNTYKDNFWGQFAASYRVGRLGQDSAKAWSKYVISGDESDREYAESLDKVIALIQKNNESVYADDATLPWISQSLANYLPQLFDQTKAMAGGGIVGAAGGSLVGHPLAGAKIGATAASGAYSYDVMRGHAFKGLVELGVDEETARKAASDEAVLSALVEMADTGTDLVTLGFSGLLKAIGKNAVKETAKSAGKQLLKALGSYGLNIAGEYVEESIQEGISIENERRTQNGKTGKWDLAKGAKGVLWDAITGKDEEALSRIGEAGTEGAKIATMMGAPTIAINAATTGYFGRGNAKAKSPVKSNMAEPVGDNSKNTEIMKKQPMPEPANEAIRQFGETLGERGRRFLYSKYKGEGDFYTYISNFKAYYDAGAANIPFEKLQERTSQATREQFPDHIAEIVHDLGKRDALDMDASIRENVPNAVYYGKDAGLEKNNLPKDMGRKDVKTLDEAAQMLGVKMSAADNIDFEGESAGGTYLNGEVKFSKNDADYISNISHEIGHRLKETAPDDYRAISNYVMRERAGAGVDISKYIDDYISQYKGTISRDGAIEEITNNFIAKTVRDGETLNKLIEDAKQGKIDETKSVQENMNILQRFVEWIKDFISNIKTKLSKGEISSKVANEEINAAEEAIALIQKAFNTSVENASKYAGQNVNKKGGERKYIIKYTTDNVPVVRVENDILKNVPENEWVAKTKEEIKKFSQGIPVSGRLIKVNRDTRREYTNSEYSKNQKKYNKPLYRDKLNASGNLDEIVLASTNYVNEDLNHERKDSIVEFARGNVLLEIGNNQYSAEVVIGYTSQKEMLLYDVTNMIQTSFKIKNAVESDGQSAMQTPIRTDSTATTDNIPQKDNIVNSQYMQDSENDAEKKRSLKSAVEYEKEIEALTKKNKALENKLAKAERLITPDKKKLDNLANSIKMEVDSEIDHDKLYSELTKLSDATKNVVDKKITFAELKDNAKELARNILNESVRVNTEMREQYKELRNYLRTTKIYVDEDTKAAFSGDYNSFRQKNFGRLGISTTEGAGIDEIYRQLSWDYPDFFNSDAERSGKQRLEQMASVLDSLKPIYENPFSGHMDEASEWLGNSIIDNLYQQSMFDGSGKGKVELDFSTIHKEAGDVIRKIMQREADWHEKQLDKIRSEYSKKWGNRTERQKKAQKIRQIRIHFDRLSKMLTKPTDKSFIPEFVQQPVAEFLNSFDVRNDRMGVWTTDNLQRLYDIFKLIEDNKTDENLIVDPDLLENLNIVKDSVRVLSIKQDVKAIVNGRMKLSMLDVDSLESLYRAALAIENSVSGYNRIVREGRAEYISDLGKKIIKENYTEKGYTGSAYKLKQAGADLINMDMVAPWDFMHQLGDTTEGLYKDIRKGLDNKIRKVASAKDYMQTVTEKLDIEKISGENAKAKTYKLSDGNEIKLTQAQVMSLYLLSKQDAAVEHMTEGGIKSPPVVTKKGKLKTLKIEKSFKPVHLTHEDIGMIIDSLPGELKTAADKIGEFFTKECSEWGNEVSLQMYGYKKFGVKNYFPIVSEKTYINTVFGETTDVTLKNMGITKARVEHANNPIVIEDVFDVFTRQVDKMSSYNAFVIPLQNMQRVFNYKGKSESVKESIEMKFGNRALDYFSKLMTDINGSMKYEGGSEIANMLISNYKSAKMGLNLRVAMQQPFSYTRAAALINPKYLIESPSVRTDLETIYRYAPIAQWKDWGFFSMDTGRNMRDLVTNKKHLNDYTMALAGKADEMTWRRIWGAVVLETKAEHKNLTPGTLEFYNRCGERFSEIIDRTQVVDSVFHRANILRSQNGFTKLATSFMSEPIKTYNLYRTAFADYSRNKTVENRNKLVRTASVCVLSTILLGTFATGLYDTLRGEDDDETNIEKLLNKIMGKTEGEKEHSFIHRWLFNSIDNIFGDFTGMIPYAKDVVSIVQGYEVKRMDMQGFEELYNAFKRITNDKYTWLNRISIIAAKSADVFGGIPASTLRREIGDLLIKNLAKVSKNEVLEYNLKKVNYSIKSSDNVGAFVNILYDAFENNDEEAYEKIYDDMVENGVSVSKIESRLKKLFLEDVNSGKDIQSFKTTFTHAADITEGEEETEVKYSVDNLSPAQIKTYRDRYVTLENNISAGWKKYNVPRGIEQTELIKKTVKYAKEIALRDASGGEYEIETTWIKDAEKSLSNLKVSTSDYIYYMVKYDATSATMNSKKALEAVEQGVKLENYLKFKEAEKEAEKELDKIREKRKLLSGEKKLKIRTAIQKLDISADQKRKLDSWYLSN